MTCLTPRVREFNPRYAEAEPALFSRFRHFQTNIHGNRDFVEHLRNRGKFFDHEEHRERDLILIDYDDLARNVYEVTEEWAFHNGHHGTREDGVFLINGIPVLVIECKNATKDEAIALGVDQIRRYHRETPELFVPEQIFTATEAIGFSYGVTWNTVRRNIFNWKDAEVGNLEAKVKSFCDIPQVLAFLKDYIVFAEKDEELNKYIPAPAPDRRGGCNCRARYCTRPYPWPCLAHPGQRQDVHHDKGGGAAVFARLWPKSRRFS